MNASLPVQVNTPPALTMSEGELLAVLQNSLYPGAKPESIKLVVSYCRATGLDPMQKPVHIVPMDVKTNQKKPDGKFIYEKRDVVMPGVGLYRTQAARTNALVGISEPEFGPTKTLNWKAGEHGEETVSFEYPEWCRVTVKRLVGGQVAEFTAIEYWVENYATKGNDSKVPNAMWQKRPRGQLAKCTQAQALRQAFPEMVGSAPTADELEGKTIDDDAGRTIDVTPTHVEQPKARARPADTSPSSSEPQDTPPREQQRDPPAESSTAGGAAEAGEAGEVTPENALKPGQVRIIEAKMKNAGLTTIDFVAKWGKPLCGDDEFPNFKAGDVNSILEWINSKAGG